MSGENFGDYSSARSHANHWQKVIEVCTEFEDCLLVLIECDVSL